jgi:hypothetical protein
LVEQSSIRSTGVVVGRIATVVLLLLLGMFMIGMSLGALQGIQFILLIDLCQIIAVLL